MDRSASAVSMEDKENVENTPKLKCEECGKRFKRPGALNKHVNLSHPQVHVSDTQGIKFICNACNCGFSYRKTLLRHIQDKHPEEMCADISNQAYNCPICLLKFEYYVNLKQHVKRFHHESEFLIEKPVRHFKCDICKMNFLHRFDLTRHKLREHPVGVAKEIMDSKRFECRFCSKRFSYKFNLRLHCLKKHPDEWESCDVRKPKSCCCAECGKWYSNKMTITSHLRKKHPSLIKPSCRDTKNTPQIVKAAEPNTNARGHRVCPLCSRTFLRKEDIHEHFRGAHGKKVATRTFHVDDEAAFDEWRLRFEHEARCKFVKYNRYASKTELVKILVCHRSGCFESRSRGLRHQRLNGSEKINGYCPAEVRFVRNLATNRCVVHCIDEHVGHDTELRFLKLEEPTRGLELEFDAPAGDWGDTSLEEKHLLDTIVLSAWIAENEQSVLYMKGPEEADAQFPALETGADGDFVFIVMDDFQAAMFSRYASDVVAIGRTDGPTDYRLQLVVVMVVDELRQAIPCCAMLSNRHDQYVYEVLFAKLGQRAGYLQPDVFLSDVDDTYANAWCATMPAPRRQLWCSWAVKRRWEASLSRVHCAGLRKRMRSRLKRLQCELNVFRFDERLQQLLGAEDAQAGAFLADFRRHFVGHESKWAHCYRKYAGVNTNWACDRFLWSLRRASAPHSLERMLDALATQLETLAREKRVREVKGKLVAKIKEARARHLTVAQWAPEVVQSINRVSETKWLVPVDDEVYQVERVRDECDCKLVCEECGSCLHQYRCSCADNCIRFNMCVHVHAVCLLQREGGAAVEELVVDVLPCETGMCAEMENEDSFILKVEEG